VIMPEEVHVQRFHPHWIPLEDSTGGSACPTIPIAHHRIGQHVHREAGSRRTDTIPHPVPPVFGGIAAEIGPAHTARDAVEAAGEGFVDLMLTGDGHNLSMGS